MRTRRSHAAAAAREPCAAGRARTAIRRGWNAAIEARSRARRSERAARGSRTCSSSAVARMEAPLFLRLCAAWRAGDDADDARHWNDVAPREPRTRRASRRDRADGLLARAAADRARRGASFRDWDEVSFPAAYRVVGGALGASTATTRSSRISGRGRRIRCMAAVKAVPLGQSAGQRLLARARRPHRGMRRRGARASRDDAVGQHGARSRAPLGAARNAVQPALQIVTTMQT